MGLAASRNDLVTCIWEIPGKPDLIFADIQSVRKELGGWIMLEQWQIVAIPMLAFVCEYVDSTLGMGYGTTLTPAFLIMGFAPMQIVPVILLSELISGISAAFFHNHEGNVNFKLETTGIPEIIERFRCLGCIEGFKQVIPLHLKIAILLAACSVVGTVSAVFIAVNIPKLWLKLYIGCLVLSMGLAILFCINKKFRFSWRKVSFLGVVASFNKGMSGGGYGPVVTGGQILSGVEGKSAIGITSLAEGLTCLVGIISYMLISKDPLEWQLAPWIIVGAVLSVPLSAKSVKLIPPKELKMAIAVLTIILGTYTVSRTLWS